MIQCGTFLNVVDNSGAKKVMCIKIYGVNKKIANIGDIIYVTIKSLRSNRRRSIRVKKGELHKALVIRTKLTNKLKFSFNSSVHTFFKENSVILLNKQYKLLGTRIFGPLPKNFRFTKFLRIISVSAGVV